MNQTSFEVGDRVKHKVTQIESEIVQIEESLAMPHAWVIEPSELEINAAKLYRLIDLEKLEDSDKRAEKTNQVQGVNPNISLCDREPKGDSLTTNDFSKESVLTVEQELVTMRSKSLSGEQIVSKPLPVTVKSRSDNVSNTSTSNQLLRDKDTNKTNISLSKKGSEAKDDLTSNELLRDMGAEQTNISLSKNEVEAENNLISNQLLRDKCTDQINISLSKNEVEAENNLISKEFPRNKSDRKANLSPSKTRRYKGHGSGTISWRTLTRNGRDYHQPWYQYEFWDKGKCTLKSSKYIPKKLLQQVQQMNQAKVPVLEILEVLGVFGK